MFFTISDIRLLIPKDTFKDQTFFLSGIKRNSLRKTMFPLSDILKSDVKILAKKCGLDRLTHKKESTGICFVGNRDFKEFIKEVIVKKNLINPYNPVVINIHLIKNK